MARFNNPFARRQNDTATLPTHRRRSSEDTRINDRWHGREYTMAHRPPFMLWLKVTWLDILTMIIMGVIALVVFRAHPPAHRTFPITFDNGEVVYPQFAYPHITQIIPSHAATALGIGVPILSILVCQIRVRSFWDINNGIMGLLYSVLGSTVFQVMIKWLIGGLRPNFLEVCQPDITKASQPGGNATGLDGTGYGGIMWTSDICTREMDGTLSNALESFPSGHTTAMFSGMVFLYLYLNAKLKVFSNYHPSMWKLILTYAPILGATLVGGSLTVDQSHNWYDVLAGATIGTVFAFSSYRMVYAAVWDWRFNHIPLHRKLALDYALDASDGAVATRKAGWGKRRGAKNTAADKLTGRTRYSTGSRDGRGAGIPRKPVTSHHARGDRRPSADDMV
ncbi:PAP2 superfamily protein [Colletotrichum higginsianum]|uniref:PAP2 superfamily protein n=1 Tax=Colletotrichum higginsianum (strain IMI 349063) TaxID=759273 RepID=H1W1L5_COLHI|nr:PAP2 superfamily protein [Colletotrichum higginsianum IMI 349063]OBR09804.1 PAP2 superfamily protein [Colletotrichum higginsianum IMI 349063]CCF46378.1 PAP2 superfamily protein [Colletotrichum higginsianum]